MIDRGNETGQRLETPVFNDILAPLEGTAVLAACGGSYYAGRAALTGHRFGKGRGVYGDILLPPFGTAVYELN